jgi:hypothetical protein
MRFDNLSSHPDADLTARTHGRRRDERHADLNKMLIIEAR